MTNHGLAERVAQVLKANGFTNVTVAEALASRKKTSILDRSGNLGTPVLANSATMVTPMAATPVAGCAIVVTLGSDAPDSRCRRHTAIDGPDGTPHAIG